MERKGLAEEEVMCIVLVFADLLFLLEYISVLYENDDEGGDEE